jgi:hypothetical protein
MFINDLGCFTGDAFSVILWVQSALQFRNRLNLMHMQQQTLVLSNTLPRALRRLGLSVANKRARRDARAESRLRELATEAESAAGERLALVLARGRALGCDLLPCLARRLETRPALALPRSVYRSAHKACDKALRRMARESVGLDGESVERLFDATGWRDLADADNVAESVAVESFACSAIRLRAEALRASVRETCATLGTRGAVKSANAHLRRLDAWETRALALARAQAGPSLEPPRCGLLCCTRAVPPPKRLPRFAVLAAASSRAASPSLACQAAIAPSCSQTRLTAVARAWSSSIARLRVSRR